MEGFYVFDVMIDAPHITRKFYLPVWIKRVTGALFFPVVPIPIGAPDGDPLGMAALSLENEKVNIVTNMNVFKKAPCYYEGADLSDAGGEVFLDKGYGYYDFYNCNDAVSPNSYVMFKYTNRKIIKSLTEFEEFQVNIQKLTSIAGRSVKYKERTGFLRIDDISATAVVITMTVMIYLVPFTFSYTISRNSLKTEIYSFLEPVSDQPFFTEDKGDDFDEPYKLKIILRHEIDK